MSPRTLVGLLAPAPDELGDEVVCVDAGEPPTLDGLVQRAPGCGLGVIITRVQRA